MVSVPDCQVNGWGSNPSHGNSFLRHYKSSCAP